MSKSENCSQSSCHHHKVDTSKSLNGLFVALALNTGFLVIEFGGASWFNSVAILSDAFHDLGDTFLIALSIIFIFVARNIHAHSYSYGLTRFSLLGAVLTAIVITGGSLFAAFEAFKRLTIDSDSQPVALGMLFLALIGITFNSLGFYYLNGTSSLTERAIRLHLLEDVLGWVAVLIGSIAIWVFKIWAIDPILCIIIASYVAYRALVQFLEALKIFLQGVPSNLNLDEIRKIITNFEEIKTLQDLKVWSLDGESHVMSCQLKVDSDLTVEQAETLSLKIKQKIFDKDIIHCTIEFTSV